MATKVTDFEGNSANTHIMGKKAIAGKGDSRREYINDFLYFVVDSGVEGTPDALNVCSGINLDRFMPIVRLRCGLGTNPILSGLQLVNFDICSRAMAAGGSPKTAGRLGCSSIAPTDEAWYTQTLTIDNASAISPEELIGHAVMTLVSKIVTSSCLDYKAPDRLLTPDELQAYLETLCGEMPERRAA